MPWVKSAYVCMCVFRFYLSLWSSVVLSRLCHKPSEAMACVHAITVLNDCSEEFIGGNKVLFPHYKGKEKNKKISFSPFPANTFSFKCLMNYFCFPSYWSDFLDPCSQRSVVRDIQVLAQLACWWQLCPYSCLVCHHSYCSVSFWPSQAKNGTLAQEGFKILDKLKIRHCRMSYPCA